MTNETIPRAAPAPQRWRNESPGRRERVTEADAHEAAVERASTRAHTHDFQTCVAEAGSADCGLIICTICGGWQERIEGKVR